MLAVDTDVVVRYLTRDSEEQAKLSRQILEGEAIFVSLTVLLEIEWVLRSLYGYTPEDIAAGLEAVAGLSRVVVEEPAAVARALEWMATGLDFADALHLARAGHCAAFVTFDRDLIRRAKRLGTMPVRAP